MFYFAMLKILLIILTYFWSRQLEISCLPSPKGKVGCLALTESLQAFEENLDNTAIRVFSMGNYLPILGFF